MIAVILSALAIATPWSCSSSLPYSGFTYFEPVTLQPTAIVFNETAVCEQLDPPRVDFASAYALFIVIHEAAHAGRPPIYNEHDADCFSLAHIYTIARSILGFSASESTRIQRWAELVHSVALPPYAGPCPAPQFRLPPLARS